MPPVKIQTTYLPVEVELWGAIYVTVDLTAAESEREAELYSDALAADSEEESMNSWAPYFDLILKPLEGTRKPSAALRREFKAGRLTSRQVVGITLQIKAAEQGETAKILQRLAAGRPT